MSSIVWKIKHEYYSSGHRQHIFNFYFFSKYDAIKKAKKLIEETYERYGINTGIQASINDIDQYMHCAIPLDDTYIEIEEIEVEGDPKILIKLPDKGYLIAEATSGNEFPGICTGYSENGVEWSQDLCMVEQKAVENEKNLTCYVWRDVDDEDWTHRIKIDKYEDN